MREFFLGIEKREKVFSKGEDKGNANFFPEYSLIFNGEIKRRIFFLILEN